MAEDVPPAAGNLPPMPEVGEVISPKVAKLPAPTPPPMKGGVKMTVTALNREVQDSVCYGLTCLHAGWDFEAYRHFVIALKGDPDCLMAHWGVGLSLFHGSADMTSERDAALNRMLGLVDRGVGTDLEHRYVFGLAMLLKEGAQEAANVFSKAAAEYPNDPQLVLLQALLGRGGYDETGDATPDEEVAEKLVEGLIEKHPDLTYIKYALLSMRAEAPDLSGDLKMAREVCAESSEFPPYFHMLGHYEWRTGHLREAQAAFGWAGDAYAKWMRDTGLGPLDCPGWSKAETYRAVAMASKGDYETALAAAAAVAAVEVPAKSATSDGARMLLWEGKTLPARILLRRNGAGDLTAAKETLPSIETTKGLKETTLAVWSYQALANVIGAQLAMESKNREAAMLLVQDISRLGSSFVQTREVATGLGERSYWKRCFNGLETMSTELFGLMAMSGPEKDQGSAYNWFLSARGHQRRASLMMPPTVLMPMEVHISDYLSSKGDWEKAMEALEEGLKAFPNDYELLTRLEHVAAKAGKPERSAEAKAVLKKLSGE